MTTFISFWFFLQVVMRPWMGGAFTTPKHDGGLFDVNHTFRRILSKVPTMAIYAILLFSGLMLADAPTTLQGGAAALAVLLTYRAYGHGFILQFPPRTSRDDVIVTIVDDCFSNSPVAQYLGYLFIRYTLLMIGFAFILHRYAGANVTAWLMAAFVIPFIYYGCVRFLPRLGKLPMYPHHFAELGMSAVIAVALMFMW